MEARLGHDFSDVRIHVDAKAGASARAVKAQAYTVGRDVVFAAGAMAPYNRRSRHVLAHELAHAMREPRGATAARRLAVSRPDDASEQAAERVAARVLTGTGSPGHGPAQSAGSAPSRLHRLGANAGCTAAEAADIHQAIFDARGWLAKAVSAMGESPLGERARRSLRRNFGPTYGVEANRELIRNRLVAARSVLSTMPISCAGAEDATCASNPCGYTPGAGSQRAVICRNVTLVAGTAEIFQAGCVLHESFHATFARFDVDSYSGWHGHSSSTGGYPGTGIDPLVNADSYTTLVMDLS